MVLRCCVRTGVNAVVDATNTIKSATNTLIVSIDSTGMILTLTLPQGLPIYRGKKFQDDSKNKQNIINS